MSENIQDTLNQRGRIYGPFSGNADIAQNLKRVIEKHADGLEDIYLEALDMIAHKIARILNGDPSYDDNWRDIAGYAQLVVNELNDRKARIEAAQIQGMIDDGKLETVVFGPSKPFCINDIEKSLQKKEESLTPPSNQTK